MHLPGDGEVAIVSLLGRKNGSGGESEFKFYSFHGPWDGMPERRKRPSLQDWINKRDFGRAIQVIEHPTFDGQPVPAQTLNAVAADINRLLEQNLSVILMDSGGLQRTGAVCEFMNYVEDFASP